MLKNKLTVLVGLGLLVFAGWRAYERVGLARRIRQSAMTQVANDVVDVMSRLPVPGDSPSDHTGQHPDFEPGDIFGELIRAGQDLSRVGNDLLYEVAGINPSEEREIGQQAHEMIVLQTRVLRSGSNVDRLRRVAKPFLSVRKRTDLDIQFYVIEDDAVNAFAHLGGHIYVHTGLLDAIQNDDELTFVLGHEVAHVDLCHCVKSMTAVVRAQQIGGDAAGSLASIAYRAIALGYSEEQEFEADLWSYRRMCDLGYTHQQSLAGLRMLERECGDDGHVHAGPMGEIEEHFRSHPRVSDRIAALERCKR